MTFLYYQYRGRHILIKPLHEEVIRQKPIHSLYKHERIGFWYLDTECMFNSRPNQRKAHIDG